jgi:uncharacterized protein (DUF1330 family)
MAKGYLVVHLDVTDPEKFEQYRAKVPATIAQYGGKYLIRGCDMETMEGDPLPPRTVVLEFASVEQARTWYHSPEYQEIIGLRLGASTGQAQLVEGID